MRDERQRTLATAGHSFLRGFVGIGTVVMLMAGTAHAAVSIDQVPLTVRKPLPPNIVLMLDNSGSMAWNFMPDFQYLEGVTTGGHSASVDNDALIDAQNNGVYYDPTVTYTPPPKEDNSQQTPDPYPNSPGLTKAWPDGFNDVTDAVDLTQYANAQADGAGNTSAGYPHYTAAYDTDSDVGAGYSNVAYSTTTYDPTKTQAPLCSHPYSNGTCGYAHSPACNPGYGYVSKSGNCQAVYNFFQYSTGPAAGPWAVSYVASDAQGCGAQSSCVTESTAGNGTNGAPSGVTVGQNIANWFTYYRTRLLAAKSGLMTSFDALPVDTRLGFGSIDGYTTNSGRNSVPSLLAPALGSDFYAFTTKASGYSYSTGISIVKTFDDGSGTTQKSRFWSWIAGMQAGGGTPLRMAVQNIGAYYQTQQPWLTDPAAAYDKDSNPELACRQSYAILTTDGFWNGDTPSGIGNADGTSGPTVLGANGQKYTYPATAPYSDQASNTLADVAMKYWKTDLRPTVANEVPPSNDDPAFWQHMSLFTLGMGYAPTGIVGTAPDGTSPPTVPQIFQWATAGDGSHNISGFSWPAPQSGQISTIADLAHAAVDGHGGFYSARNPATFTAGIRAALARVSQRTGTGASLAANSTQLQTGTVTYQALYYTGKWKGDLEAFAVDQTTGAIATHPTWTAAAAMPAWNQRVVYTANPGATTPYFAFKPADVGDLSSAQQQALGAATATQTGMINYLLGDPELEITGGGTGTYRPRDTALGDIVDSQPVYIGAPNPNLFVNQTGIEPGYRLFAAHNANRTAALWVAANDGMLHAFDATDGHEIYAFLPGAVITAETADAAWPGRGIANLADPNYGGSNPHEYFNDGQLAVADAYVGGTWKTVLVGTTGRGEAKAIYALDITDPANVKFLWERSAGDGGSGSSSIGQITGAPVIGRTADGWKVFVGNGYNSADKTAALLQFSLDDGSLKVYPTSDATTDNGLAPPVVWISNPGVGISTTAYAGDLHGQVWSFDLTNPGSTGTLLFTASYKDAGGVTTTQPITSGMLAGQDPVTQARWIFFGTGRYLAQADLADLSTQSWYGLIVQPGPSQPQNLTAQLANGRAVLAQRTIAAEVSPDVSANPPTLGGRVLTSAGSMTGKSGWYIDLTSPLKGTQGERIVLANQFQGSLLMATTRIPESSDPCNPSGTGWIMAVFPFSGTNPVVPFFDLNGDHQYNGLDEIELNGTPYASAAVGFDSVPNAPIFVGNTMLTSFDNASTSSIDTSGTTGDKARIAWREMAQ